MVAVNVQLGELHSCYGKQRKYGVKADPRNAALGCYHDIVACDFTDLPDADVLATKARVVQVADGRLHVIP